MDCYVTKLPKYITKCYALSYLLLIVLHASTLMVK